jgi:phosphoribosyl 1,2-cyclic phosphodiesterase
VKQRIMSRHGHLSNAAAAQVVADLLGEQLQRTLLGHLSRDCNSPDLAIGAVRAKLEEYGGQHVEVICADQREVTSRFEVGGIPARLGSLSCCEEPF